MEYTIQTLISFLEENNIPFEMGEEGSIFFKEEDLLPYEALLRKIFHSLPIPSEYKDQHEASGKKKKKIENNFDI